MLTDSCEDGGDEIDFATRGRSARPGTPGSSLDRPLNRACRVLLCGPSRGVYN